MRRTPFAVLIPLLLVPRPASPQGEPLGPEFRVNTYTANQQIFPSVASAGGDFMVVWDSVIASGGIVAQRFDTGGTPLGTEFRVNTYNGTEVDTPAVGANGSGFVVVWQNVHLVTPEPVPLFTWSVLGQRYEASGAPMGMEFRVNGPVDSAQDRPLVAVAPSGAFLVVWSRALSQAPPGPYDVYARRYDSAGLPQGPEFRVNAYTPYSQTAGSVAADPAGNFVVVWTNSSYVEGDVIGQRFAASGEPLGPQFRVNTDTAPAGFPAVATDPSGNFTVSWVSAEPAGSEEIFGQRFGSSGTPVGPEFQVNTSTTGNQTRPAIAADAAGNFVIVWWDYLSGPSGNIFGQRYSDNGVPSGPEFRVNTATLLSQSSRPPVASAPDGTFLVTWHAGSIGQEDIFGQRFGGIFPVKLQGFRVN